MSWNLLLCRLPLIDLKWIEWLHENLRYKSHDLLPVFLPLETLLLCVFLNEKMQASKIHCWLIEITHDICKFFLHLQLLIRLFRFRSRYERYTQLTRRFLRSFIQVVPGWWYSHSPNNNPPPPSPQAQQRHTTTTTFIIYSAPFLKK